MESAKGKLMWKEHSDKKKLLFMFSFVYSKHSTEWLRL